MDKHHPDYDEIRALVAWAMGAFDRGTYLGDVARQEIDAISPDEAFHLQCAREGWLASDSDYFEE